MGFAEAVEHGVHHRVERKEDIGDEQDAEGGNSPAHGCWVVGQQAGEYGEGRGERNPDQHHRCRDDQRRRREPAHLGNVVGVVGEQCLGRVGEGQHRHQHKAPKELDSDIIAADLLGADGVDNADDHKEVGEVADETVGAAAQPHAQVLAHTGESRQGFQVAESDFFGPQQQDDANQEQAGGGEQGRPANANHASVQGIGVTAEEQAVQRKAQQYVDYRHNEHQHPQAQGFKEDDNGGGQYGEGNAEYADAQEGAGLRADFGGGSNQGNEGVPK